MLAERVKTWTEEWKQQGVPLGEAKLLRRLLIRRFGALPAWAESRVEQAGEASLRYGRIASSTAQPWKRCSGTRPEDRACAS
jgi:hypothetical protein